MSLSPDRPRGHDTKISSQKIAEIIEATIDPKILSKINTALKKYSQEIGREISLADYVESLPEPAVLQAALPKTDKVVVEAYIYVIKTNLMIDLY